MAFQWRGFECLRQLGEELLPLENDLRNLDNYLHTIDQRIALLDSSEPLGIVAGQQRVSNLTMHAYTHASPIDTPSHATATDPLTIYPFKWTELHKFAPRVAGEIPVTLTQTSEQLRIEYDSSNYINVSVDSVGLATFDRVGSDETTNPESFRFLIPTQASGTDPPGLTVYEDTAGADTLRMRVRFDGTTDWHLKDASGNNAGVFSITTPIGSAGMAFRDKDDAGFSTFRQLSALGGFVWSAHSATHTTIPPELMRLNADTGHLGLGTLADAKARLHVIESVSISGASPQAGAVTALFESSTGDAGITIMSNAATDKGNIHFDDTAGSPGRIQYDHNVESLALATGIVGNAGASLIRVFLDKSGMQIKAGEDVSAVSASAPLHVIDGTSQPAFAAPNSSAALVVLDSSAANDGITIRTTGSGNIFFGDVAASAQGRIAYAHSRNALDFYTNAARRMVLDTPGLLVDILDSNAGAAPLATIHTISNTGVVPSRPTLLVAANDMLIENNNDVGITLLCPSNDFGVIAFADNDGKTDEAAAGRILYNHASDSLDFWTQKTSTGVSVARYRMDETGLLVDPEGNVGAPGVALHVVRTTEQLRLAYDASNYCSFTVDSTGDMVVACTGTNPTFTFSDGLILGSTTTTATCVLKVQLPDEDGTPAGTDFHFCNRAGEFNAMSFQSNTKDGDPGGIGVPKYAFIFKQTESSNTVGPSLGHTAWVDNGGSVAAVLDEGGVLFNDNTQAAGRAAGSAYIWATADMTADPTWTTKGGISGKFVWVTGSTIDYQSGHTTTFENGSLFLLEEVTVSPPTTPGGNIIQLYCDSSDAAEAGTIGATDDRLFLINSSGTGGAVQMVNEVVTSSVNSDAAIHTEFQFKGTGTITPNQLGSNIRLYRNATTSAGYIFVNTSDQMVFDSNTQASEGDTGQGYIDLTNGNISFVQGDFSGDVILADDQGVFAVRGNDSSTFPNSHSVFGVDFGGTVTSNKNGLQASYDWKNSNASSTTGTGVQCKGDFSSGTANAQLNSIVGGEFTGAFSGTANGRDVTGGAVGVCGGDFRANITQTGTSATVAFAQAGLFTLNASGQNIAITTAVGLQVVSPTAMGASTTMTNYYGIRIGDCKGSSSFGTTHNVAIRVDSQTCNDALEGNIRMYGGDFTNGHIQLDNLHMFKDDTNNVFRFSVGTPSNATDGLGLSETTQALGGGAAPTLGTIGGSGPATATQNRWLEIYINATKYFIPIWA